MTYQPIENYGVIGDLNTVALVGLNGSVDFMCYPRFDSPSLFAALLDSEKGGYFKIEPLFTEMKTRQLYLPDTNVLLTKFLSKDGVGEITDFMPVEDSGENSLLVRRVSTVRGKVRYSLECTPRFNYGTSGHTLKKIAENKIVFNSEDGLELCLCATVPLQVHDGGVVADFTLGLNETADFVLTPPALIPEAPPELQQFVTGLLLATVNYWKEWVAQSRYRGRWQSVVNRSALILKLLTSRRFGSIIAAATFGLPESIGGKRNWDYRYTWIRDASFSMHALIGLGYVKEAGAFMNWVEQRCEGIKNRDQLGIMYSVEGLTLQEEAALPLFEGYKGSAPVRVGNDAYSQLQLDIYGELMDAVYLYNKHGEPISYDFWKDLEKQVDWLCGNWRQPDDGIWEVRGGRRNFLYSRVQCWVALDRAIRIAEDRSFPYDQSWKSVRDAIFSSVYADFWNEELQCFVQYKGSKSVDAASLMMPLCRFISPRDPRWMSTLHRIETELVSDSLVFRYNPAQAAPDGFDSREGTFSMCSFWYVECLSRSGQLEKARFYFEKMLSYANHLGLYAEQLGFEGEHLGNFPQAFTHLALISAAVNLDRQFDDSRNKNVRP